MPPMILDPTAINQPPQVQTPLASPYPQGYATPAQVKTMDDYARALLAQSGQAVPGTKGGWTVGVQHLIDALVGGNQAYLSGQRQLASQGYDARQKPMAPNAPTSTTTSLNAPSQAPLGGALKLASLGGTDGLLSKAAATTSSQESGGNYSSDTKSISQTTGKEQHALGKYGIMDFNVGPWSKEVLGKELTPQQFLADPHAQDAIYKAKMGGYIQKYGPEGAGQAWLGGPGGVGHPERTDSLGTSIGSYGKKFAQGLGSPAQPYGSEQPYIPPYAVPQRPSVSRQQFERLEGSPWQSEAQKNVIQGQYLQQYQPLSLPYMGGNLIVNPQNRSQQFFAPGIQTLEKSIGPIKKNYPTYLMPNRGGGASVIAPPITTPNTVPGPQGALTAPVGAAPAAMQGPAFGSAAPATGTPPAAVAAAAPVIPATAGTPSVAPPVARAGQQPVNMASLGNIHIPEGAAAGAETKLPGAPPPDVVAQNAAPTASGASTPAYAPGAFPAPPPGVDPEDWAQYTATQRSDAAKAALEENLKGSAAAYAKQYTNYIDQARQSGFELPQLEMAKNLVNDPNNVQGLFSQPALFYKKLTDALGVTTGTAAPILVFQKAVANSILQGLRQFTQGASVGQIRTAEIALQKQAAASSANTPEANMALLNIATKLQKQSIQIGNMAAAYKAQHGALDAGFDKEILKYQKDNPILQPNDFKLISDLGKAADKSLKGQKGATQGATPGTPPTIKDTDKAAYDALPHGAPFVDERGNHWKKP